MGEVSAVTLGEAFSTCDVEWLANAVVQFQSEWKISPPIMGERRFNEIVRKVAASLAEMEGLEEAGVSAARTCFIPLWRYELDDHRLAVRLHYLWVDEPALQRLASEFARAEERSKAMAALDRAGWGLRLQALGRSSDLSAWAAPDVLAARLLITERLSPFEYHCFLAAIFWSLTERGFNDLGEEEVFSEPEPEAADAEGEARQLFHWLSAPVDPGASGGSIARFELAAGRSEMARCALLNARECWEALAALVSDINRLETKEP